MSLYRKGRDVANYRRGVTRFEGKERKEETNETSSQKFLRLRYGRLTLSRMGQAWTEPKCRGFTAGCPSD